MDCQVFAKHIIAFPQELSEAKQLLNFWTILIENDIVNVSPKPGIVADVKRGRILHVRHHGFDVMYHDLET